MGSPDDARLREIAREEARAVYQDLGVEAADGSTATLGGLMENFGLSRRDALKALGLVAAGYAVPTAAIKVMSEPASAAPVGQIGTSAEPISQLYVDTLGDATTPVSVLTTDQLSINQVVGVLGWSDSGTAQTISNNTTDKIDWTDEVLEDSNVVTISATNDNITVDVAGLYSISAYCQLSPVTSSGAVRLLVFKNGSQIVETEFEASTSTDTTLVIPRRVESLSANDTLDIRLTNLTGNTEDLNQDFADAADLAQFTVQKIR